MIKNYKLILIMLGVYLATFNSQASVIKNIYEVSLPVVSQESKIRRAAFEQGLIEVAVRVSGSSLAPTQLDLAHASRTVRQYRYKTMSQEEIDAYMQKSKALVAPKYKLWMQFDDGKIKLLLKNNGLPIWGYQRPNVLVWMAVKDGRNRYLLKNSDRSLIKDAVEEQARRRGLPIIWPEHDTADRKLINFSDVWGQFIEPVKQASQRYPVDAFVMGRMNWLNGNWHVDWTLVTEDKLESWQIAAQDLNMLMMSGIGVATDHIASRFAVFADSGQSADLRIRISDLNTIQRYAKAAKYLASLAPVKNVFATDVNQGYIDFHVELTGDEQDLKRFIALGKVLEPDTRPAIKPAIVPAEDSRLPTQDNPTEQQPAIDQENASGLPVVPVQPVPEAHILRYRMNG